MELDGAEAMREPDCFTKDECDLYHERIITVRRIEYAGCVRAIQILSPHQLILGHGSQVKYYVFESKKNQWYMKSCLFFATLGNECKQAIKPFSQPTKLLHERKSDAVCSLSSSVICSQIVGFIRRGFGTCGASQDFLESGMSWFLIFAFSLGSFHLYYIGPALKRNKKNRCDITPQLDSELKSCCFQFVISRILAVHVLWSNDLIENKQLRTISDSHDSLLHCGRVLVAFSSSMIDVHSLMFIKSVCSFQLTACLLRIELDSTCLLFSFSLISLKSSDKEIEHFCLCAGGTMDAKIYLWQLDLSEPHRVELNQQDGDHTVKKNLFTTKTFSQRQTGVLFNRQRQLIQHHSGSIFRIRFFLRGKLMVAAAEDRTLSVWRSSDPGFAEYTLQSILKGHQNRIWDVDGFFYSKMRFLLVSVGEDNLCYVWDVDGCLLYQFLAHLGRGITSVCVSASHGERNFPFATGGMDGGVKLWSLKHLKHMIRSSSKNVTASKTALAPFNNWTIGLRQLEQCLSTPKDWIRDVTFVSPNHCIFITNFGCILFLSIPHCKTLEKSHEGDKLLRVFHPSCRVHLHENHYAIVCRIAYFDYLLTCLSLPSNIAHPLLETDENEVSFNDSKDAVLNYNGLTFLAVGTSCGKCCLLGQYTTSNLINIMTPMDLSQLESCSIEYHVNSVGLFKELQGERANKQTNRLEELKLWKCYFSVFEHSRVQRVFSFSISQFEACNAVCQGVYLVIVTNHEGDVLIYWVDILLCILQAFGKRDCMQIPSEKLSEYGIYLLTKTTLKGDHCDPHDNRLFSAALLATLENWEKCVDAKKYTLLFSILMGDEHGTVHFSRFYRQLRKCYIGVQDGDFVRFVKHCMVMHPYRESLWKNQRLTTKKACKLHWIEFSSQNTNELGYATVQISVNDGTLHRFKWLHNGFPDKNAWTSLEGIEPNMALDLEVTEQHPRYRVIWKAIRLSDGFQKRNYLACFHGADFILWCPRTNTEVWKFSCGGSRRPFHILNFSLAQHGVLQNWITVLFSVGSNLVFRGIQVAEQNTMARYSNKQPFSDFCYSVLETSHGKEIWCGEWLTSSLLCTGGEDGSLREMFLNLSQDVKLKEEEKQQTFTCGFTHINTHSTLRCLDTCSLILSDHHLTFLVTGGARQYIVVYYTESPSLGSPVLHLLKKFQIPLFHDERLLALSCFVTQGTSMKACKGTTASHFQERLYIHCLIGTSSGKLLYLDIPIQIQAWDSLILVSSCTKEKYKTTNNCTSQETILLAQHPHAVLCCKFLQYPPQESFDGLIAGLFHCGCVNGSVYCYSLAYDISRSAISCKFLNSYKPHQTGTICLTVCDIKNLKVDKIFSSFIKTLVLPTSSSSPQTLSFVKLLKRPCSPHNEENDALGQPTDCFLLIPPRKPFMYYVATGGDDNSISVQPIFVSNTLPQAVVSFPQFARVPRAHFSSIRGIGWSFPFLISVGWDKLLNFWMIHLSDSLCEVSSLIQQSYTTKIVDGDPFQQSPLTSTRVRLIMSIATQIGDAAGLSVKTLNNKRETIQPNLLTHFRLAVYGALGVEVLDIEF